MNSKIVALSVVLGIGLSTTTMVTAADYDSFLSPSSLGKDVNTVNRQYKLGLKKQTWGDYSNSDAEDCSLRVEVNKHDQITSIRSKPNNGQCHYNTLSSGVTFNSKTTKVVDILNQTDIESVRFIPGCFNCPSRLELADNLVINRAQDNYYTEFEISGYNTEYLKFMGETLFGKFDRDNHYPTMDKLDAKLNHHSPEYNRKDFKLKAIKSYDLQEQPWRYYKIGLK